MKYEEFKGKRVFITGICGGIGFGIAEQFAGSGAIIIATDLNEERLREKVSQLNERFGPCCKTYPMDVTQKDSVENVVAASERNHGPVDILINCAGVSSMIEVVDMDEEDWDFNFNVNAKGVFLASKYIARQMIKNKTPGKIVSIASMAGKLAARFLAHYSASKFAVVGFTQGFAIEMAPYKINVNCVCPAFVQTEMQAREVQWESGLRGVSPEQVIQDYIKMTPLGRLEQPGDVANLVLFLSSGGADFMTGQAVNITGGALLI
jgi:NAD(P)-dependent dehydrogenase (short-subunit alcohol dehydrogenase family)